MASGTDDALSSAGNVLSGNNSLTWSLLEKESFFFCFEIVGRMQILNMYALQH